MTTLRYCIFLGAYGIFSSIFTITSLFIASIPTIVPLLINIIGAGLFLGGGITWVVNLSRLSASCSTVQQSLDGVGLKSLAKHIGNSCRISVVNEGLLFTLCGLSVIIAVCCFLHRRNLKQSAKYQ